MIIFIFLIHCDEVLASSSEPIILFLSLSLTRLVLIHIIAIVIQSMKAEQICYETRY